MIKQTAIALGMMVATGAAFAGQHETEAHVDAEAGAYVDVAPTPAFAAIDANGDGQISWAEAEANGMTKSTFHSFETSQDGAVNMAEFEAALAARGGVVGEAAEKGEPHPVESDGMMDSHDDMKDAHDMDSMANDAMDMTTDTTMDAGAEAGTTVKEAAGSVLGTTEADVQGSIGAEAEAGVE